MILALLLALEEVLREMQDILRSRRKLRLRQQWAERRLHDDLRCSHPMWPQVGNNRFEGTVHLTCVCSSSSVCVCV